MDATNREGEVVLELDEADVLMERPLDGVACDGGDCTDDEDVEDVEALAKGTFEAAEGERALEGVEPLGFILVFPLLSPNLSVKKCLNDIFYYCSLVN